MEKINETNSFFLLKINKIDKLLARFKKRADPNKQNKKMKEEK